MKTIGSQKRETLEESGMVLVKRRNKNEVLLAYADEPDIQEVWYKNDDYAGYVIEINGSGYEFITTL